MKKLYITGLFIFSIFTLTNAQTFVCAPANMLNVGAPTNTFSNFNIDMVNQGSDTMTLAWILINNTMHADWEWSICDYTACYTILPQSSVMSPNVGSASFLKLILNPKNTIASAQLKFWVFDNNNPTIGDTVTFNISSGFVSIGENEKEILSIYPNPAKEYFTVRNDDASQVKLYSLSGSLISSYKIESNRQQIPVQDLKAGLYMVQVELKNGEIRSTKLLIEK